jgi:hypothetical protein
LIFIDLQLFTEELDYVVLDITGREVMAGKLSGAMVNTVSLENLSKGMYVIRINGDQKTHSALISKQ